jgi:hypothetical protein
VDGLDSQNSQLGIIRIIQYPLKYKYQDEDKINQNNNYYLFFSFRTHHNNKVQYK